MRRVLTVISCAIAACFVCAALAGCEESDRLTEILYVQDSPIADYDNEQKIRTFDENGDTYDPSAPVMRLDEEGHSDYQTVRMAYSSTPETNLPTPRYVYDPDGHYDSEASEVPVAVPDETVPPEEDSPVQEPEDFAESPDPGVESGGSDDTSGNGDAESSSPDSEPTDREGESGRTARGQQQVYDLRGEYTDIPKANTVAAYGATAVAVQMLCGQGPLLGTDAVTLSGGFSTVFADEGALSLPAMWADGGTATGVDIDAILDANVDVVIIDSVNALTEEQQAELNSWGTAVIVIPGFSSATKMLNSVSILGEMLEGSSALGLGVSPRGRAAEYISYHQALCKEIMDANGGYTTYQLASEANGDAQNDWFLVDAGQNITYSNRFMYTLLIEEWDYDARYKGMTGDQRLLNSNYGVGFAKVGRSAVSYYMGVGGAANNAAFGGDWEKLGVVWQFRPMNAKADAVNWNYGPTSPFARGVISIDKFSQMEKVLLYSAEHRWRYACQFGEAGYPAVIVMDTRMRDALLADARSGSGIYSAYGDTTIVDGAQVTGLRLPNGTVIQGAISPAINWDTAILIQPDGLVSSWIEGSVESVLEAPWIASQWQFQTGWRGNFEQEIRDFYRTFYRHELSDAELADIIDGA